MNLETVITISLFALIWEATKFAFKIGMTFFFQKQHADAVLKKQISIKDRLKIANVAKSKK